MKRHHELPNLILNHVSRRRIQRIQSQVAWEERDRVLQSILIDNIDKI